MNSMYKITLAILLLLISSSCQDNFLDVNTDPNNSSRTTVNLVLPAAIGSSAYVIGGWYQIIGGMWAQHWTQATGASQYEGFDSYDFSGTTLDTRQYGTLYAGALNDYQYIRKVASADENWTYYLIATAMQAYTFQLLADVYDKIPFSEALKGDEGILTPKFDDGTVVYDSLIARLNDALSKDLSVSTAETPGSNDLIFRGNMENWIKFVNTLKLKIYLRQSYARPEIAAAGIQSLFANPNFLEADAAMTAFRNEVDGRNPVYETGVDRLAGNISASNTAVSFLLNNNDPRLDQLYSRPINSNVHVALDQGDFQRTTPSNISGLSIPRLQPLDPVFFFTQEESYFLQAEAVLRFGVPGDAQELYQKGIQASFVRMGLSNATDFYDTGKSYEFSGSDEQKLEQIITQKWISMINKQGLESWIEQNRTGYPDFFTVSRNTVIGNNFPRRFIYPSSEQSRNLAANIPQIKSVVEPVWWDVKL